MNRSPNSSTFLTPFLVSEIAAFGLLAAGGAWLSGSVALGQSTNPFLSSVPGYPNWSAFTGVRWEGDKPIVRFEDQWYELVSFHGIPVEEILKHCDEKGWPKQMRFTEDLVQIVRLMGHKIDKTTNLVLRDESGNVVTKNDVVMTEANLRTMMGERSSRGAMPPTLTREDVLADLAEFQTNLESQFSYLRANDADYVAAIQAIAQKAGDEMETVKFAAELRKVMALFIDAHAGVSPSGAGYKPGYLPFRIEPSGERFVAVRPDRSGFLDDELPYIRAIDGVELSRWLAAAAVDVPKGSPQFVRDRGLMLIALVQHFRGELGLEVKDTIAGRARQS